MVDVVTANMAKELAKVKDAANAALADTATTAQLASLTATINTTGKFIGKRVFNTTTNKLVCAVGANANSVWANSGTGVTEHTPV